MQIEILNTKKELGHQAGQQAGKAIREAIQKNGTANIILATGASQFETLNALVEYKDIDWSKVVMFHLDEYIGIPETHPASFRKYLKERFVDKVGALKAVHLIDGNHENPREYCQELGKIIAHHPIDVALAGIGENGHLAFNDPPADFNTLEPYIVVELDEACRKQQMNEGWFSTFDEVPRKAISMSIQQIMKSRKIICAVPDERKAEAVKNCLEGNITNLHPASILQEHPDCTFYLDKGSASLLSKQNK